MTSLSKIYDSVIAGCMGEWRPDFASHDFLSNKVESFLINTEFNEQDLREFISVKSEDILDEDKSRVRGFYTGCLLYLLTKRNRERGRKTIFHINGQGKMFDFLFSHAKMVDEVIVDNFRGNFICSEVGRYKVKNKSNLVMVVNCTGNHIAERVGSGEGSYVNSVIVANNKGDHAAAATGSHHGNVGSVIVSNNEGSLAAYNVADCGGKVDYVMVTNNKGYAAADSIACVDGKCDLVMIANNEGEFVARSIGHRTDRKLYGVNQVIISNAKGKDPALGVHAKKLVLHKVDGFRGVSDEGSSGYHGDVDEIIKVENVSEEYQILIRLADSMRDMVDYREIQATAAGIDLFYQRAG